MVGSIPRTLAGAVLLAACAAQAESLPPLKSGLWETTTTANGVASTTKACIREQASRETTDPSHRHCRETVTRTAAGYDVSMRCAFGPATAGGVNHVTGDFETFVRMEAIFTPDNPRPSEPTTITMLSQMRRLGDCEAERNSNRSIGKQRR